MSIKLVSFESSCSAEPYGDELIEVSPTNGMIEEALFLIEVCRVYVWWKKSSWECKHYKQIDSTCRVVHVRVLWCICSEIVVWCDVVAIVFTFNIFSTWRFVNRKRDKKHTLWQVWSKLHLLNSHFHTFSSKAFLPDLLEATWGTIYFHSTNFLTLSRTGTCASLSQQTKKLWQRVLWNQLVLVQYIYIIQEAPGQLRLPWSK